MKLQQWFWVGLITIIVSACGSPSPEAKKAPITAEQMAKLGPELPDDSMGQKLRQCYDLFASIEEKRRVAGVWHRGYFQVEGYPYVRVDRLMASFAGQLPSIDHSGPWFEQMREYAAFSRAAELRDIGLEPRERANLLYETSLCSVWLTLYTLDQEETRIRLEQAIRDSIPPPTKPASNKQTTPQPVDPSKLQQWRAVAPEGTASEETARAHYEACNRDLLGRTKLFSSGWQRFATENAPTILSPQPLVAPQFDAKGTIVNTGPATLHYQPGFIRAGGQTLLQYVYYIWTANSSQADDGFRGIIWRVILAPDGRPLIYDSMGLDGSNHRWFAARKLHAEDQEHISQELIGATRITLTLSADAQLYSVAPSSNSKKTSTNDFSLALYDDLSEMPTYDDQQRSMFDSRGRLRVKGPAVYMLGQHPAINGAQQAFDDPKLIDSVFKLDPAWLKATNPEACQPKPPQRSPQEAALSLKPRAANPG